ncbi:hypothetical protein ACFLQ8_01975 [Candidatus Auribacterota bacterium]
MKYIKFIITLVVFLSVNGTLSLCAVSQENIDPVKMLRETSERFNELRTYSCKATSIFKVYKGNRVKTHQDIVLYVFQKPMSIKMTWLKPWNIKGQVAVYSDEQLKVKLNWLPVWMPMNPDGNIAKDAAGNRIYQTDLGTLIGQVMEIIDHSEINYEGSAVSKDSREIMKVSLKSDDELVYVSIDKETGLPVTFEIYGPDMKLRQAAYFEDLQINIPVSPYEFTVE